MKLFGQWEGRKARWRYEYGPRAARWLLGLSTYPARQALKRQKIVVLIDSSILSHATTHKTTWISTGPKRWGETQIDTGYLARVPVHAFNEQSDEYESVRYLAGIAHLARVGTILLKTSAELEAERRSQPPGRFSGYGLYDHNVFRDIQMPSLDGRVWPQFGMSSNRSQKPSSRSRGQQRMRLQESDDPLYRALLAHLPKHTQDMWHIRTAEVHGAYCFLTMDGRLMRALRSGIATKEPFKSLRTFIMTPEDFGKRWGIRPLAPYIFSYDGAAFPVHSEYYLPNAKRGKRGYWSNKK